MRNFLFTAVLVIAGAGVGAGAIALVPNDDHEGYKTAEFVEMKEEIGSEIILFSIPGCDYCRMNREWLARKLPGFTEISLADYPEYTSPLIEMTGIPAVPVTIIGNALVSGYDEAHLDKALRRYRDASNR